jgi:lysylphosphatidylglycerol synthetase-like protein (DUF2156 family)
MARIPPALAKKTLAVFLAVLSFVAAGGAFWDYRDSLFAALEWEAQGKKMPPTLMSSPAGWCVAMVVFGLISLVWGFAVDRPSQASDKSNEHIRR